MEAVNRLALVTVCCYLAASAAAAAADAPHVQERIVPGQSIGPVKLGMTTAQVRRALGPPESTIERRSLGFGKSFVELGWNLGEWRIGFVNGRVVRIASSKRTERTSERIGPGSLGKQVERVHGVRCVFAFFKAEGNRFADYWCVVRNRGGARTAYVVWGVCTKPRFNGNCPGNDFRYEVRDVWIFAAGQELPVTLHPSQPLP